MESCEGLWLLLDGRERCLDIEGYLSEALQYNTQTAWNLTHSHIQIHTEKTSFLLFIIGDWFQLILHYYSYLPHFRTKLYFSSFTGGSSYLL